MGKANLTAGPLQGKAATPVPPGGTPTVLNAALAQLTEGQVIQATVQRVTTALVWLDLDGRTILARTEVPLQPNQRVSLQVAEANQARVALRVLNQATPSAIEMQTGKDSTSPNSGPARGLLAPGLSNLEGLLASWGIEPDNANLVIAKALLVQAHSINPEDVETVRSWWRTLPNRGLGDIEALVYLHTNQLPVGEEPLALAHHYLAHPQVPLGDRSPAGNGLAPVATRLADLQQVMGDVLAQLHLAEAGSPALVRLRGELEAALTHIMNWPISPDMTAGEIATRLAELVRSLGTPPEAELATHLLTTAKGEVGSSVETAQAVAPFEETSPFTLRVLGEDSAELRDPMAQLQAKPAIPGMGKDTTNWLSRLVSSVADALSEKDSANPAQGNGLDEPTARALRQLEDQLDLVSKDLGSIHLSNLARPQDALAEQCCCLPIPLTTTSGPRTAYLKIYRRPGHLAVDPHNLRLALLLDLPELGEIAIDMSIFERRLSGQILSGRRLTNHLVEMDMGHLYERINALGYQIDSLTCDMLPGGPQGPATRASQTERDRDGTGWLPGGPGWPQSGADGQAVSWAELLAQVDVSV
jgi:hypothetical protein